jgi:hypothetical protein
MVLVIGGKIMSDTNIPMVSLNGSTFVVSFTMADKIRIVEAVLREGKK